MAVFAGISSLSSSSSSSSMVARGRKGVKPAKTRRSNGSVCVASASGVAGNLTEQYRTLRIQPGATEMEVKKAFRQLALQFHPDVCKGSNCRVKFHQINEAYDIVISSLRASEEEKEQQKGGSSHEGWVEDDSSNEPLQGMCDPNWDLWEEWMGWEGAGIRDYSSHINPYI